EFRTLIESEFRDLTLAEYIAFRRKYPGYHRTLGGLDTYSDMLPYLFRESKKHGLDEALVVWALTADYPDEDYPRSDPLYDPVSELSLRLLEPLLSRKELLASGQTQLARRRRTVPNHLISELALAMLEKCGEEGKEPPLDLAVLLRVHLVRT